MPFSLLDRLTREYCPYVVEATEDIHKLLSLSAAGLVIAEIPAFDRGANDVGQYIQPATVIAVTPAGVAALKKHRKRIRQNK